MKLERTFLRSKIARRIFFLFFFLALVPVFGLTVVSLVQVESLINAQTHQQLHKDTKAYGLLMYDRLLFLESELVELASDVSKEQLDEVTQFGSDHVNWFRSLAVIKNVNQQIALFGHMDDMTDFIHLNSAENAHLHANGSLLLTKVRPGTHPGIFMIRALDTQHLEQGIVVGEVNPGYLLGDADILDAASNYCLLDQSHRVLYCSQQEIEAVSEQVVQQFKVSSTGQFYWKNQGEDFIVNYWMVFLKPHFFIPGWTVVVSWPKSTVFAPLGDFRNMFIGIILLTVLVVSFLSLYQIRISLYPLEQLMDGIQRLGNNDFRNPVEIKTKDEFALLAQSFNTMARQLDRQFNAMKVLAEIDRLVLSKFIIEDIIEIILIRIRELIPCDIVNVLMLHSEKGKPDHIYMRDRRAKNGFSVIMGELTEEDIQVMYANPRVLIQSRYEVLPAYLEPLAECGFEVFIIFPVMLQGRLSAAICLGCQGASPVSQEDMARGRDLADRMAVGLAKAAWEKQLCYQAQHDFLTDLPNRMLLQDRLQQALVQAERHGHEVAVLFIDLDRFKDINDSLGHKAGDAVLMETARRLRRLTRQSDTLARLGGDEFVIVIPALDDKTDSLMVTSLVAGKLLAETAKPFILEERKIYLTTSIGISLYPRDGNNLDDLLKNADSALYHAKTQGKNNFQFFTHELNVAAFARLDLENKLHHALEANEFELYYQPKIELRSGRICGAEALLRWKHPQDGMIPPAKFLPLAEQVGLIIAIEEWVINTVCRQARIWQDQDFPALRIAVNVSAAHFRQPELATKIQRALERSGLESSRLEIEITEGTAMENLQETVRILTLLDHMGLHLAIDDFGTGYSSLSYLKYFPIHTLKIDQSFVRNIATNPRDAAIVKSIVVLAHSLGLNVVAEGVETEHQLEYLRSQGCEEVQGYLFSRPLPLQEFNRILIKNVNMALLPNPDEGIGCRHQPGEMT